MKTVMPKRIHITTPRPTPDEVAEIFHIPKRRQKELQALAEEFVKNLRESRRNSGDQTAEKRKKRKNASAAA